MKRHILFHKSIALANVLLATGKCKNEGRWIFTCKDNVEDMQILQKACSEFLKNTDYRNYKLCFGEPNNYGKFITI